MLQQLSFPDMSVTMHRPCMTSHTCVKPTAKHLSLFRHGHLRCLPCCLKHLMEGTEIYAMSAIKLQNDMICTCFTYAELMFANVHTRTDTWYYEPCNIVQFMDSFLYVRPLWHPCVKHVMTSLSRPRVVWNIVQRQLRRRQTGDARISFQECCGRVSVSLASCLRIANFAFQEVTHQNGFTLYVFSQTIFMLH